MSDGFLTLTFDDRHFCTLKLFLDIKWIDDRDCHLYDQKNAYYFIKSNIRSLNRNEAKTRQMLLIYFHIPSLRDELGRFGGHVIRAICPCNIYPLYPTFI